MNNSESWLVLIRGETRRASKSCDRNGGQTHLPNNPCHARHGANLSLISTLTRTRTSRECLIWIAGHKLSTQNICFTSFSNSILIKFRVSIKKNNTTLYVTHVTLIISSSVIITAFIYYAFNGRIYELMVQNPVPNAIYLISPLMLEAQFTFQTSVVGWPIRCFINQHTPKVGEMKHQREF